MLKYFKIILTVDMLLCTSSLMAAKLCQLVNSDTTVRILIESRMEISPKPRFIDILVENKKLDIACTLVESINLQELLQDTAYVSANKKYRQGKYPISLRMNFYKKYGSSTTDKVSAIDKQLTDLLAELNTATVEDIERNEANKNRHMMDGYRFYLEVVTSSGVKQVYADSPDEKSHPLLNAILKKCMDILSLKHPPRK